MAGITKLHRVIIQPAEGRRERRPERFHRQEQLQQRHEIVRSGRGQSGFFEPRFEIFFRALLTVEADAVGGGFCATSKSSSAQRTHSRAAGFIHDLAFVQDGLRETVAAAHLPRLPHQQIHRERRFRAAANFYDLLGRAPAKRHDHDQIYV